MKYRKFSGLLCGALMAVYLLGVHEGKIALWSGDDPQPIQVFPYRVSMLPKKERKMLQEGIRVETLEELYALAEAYLS
jgi:hypothetical protein